MVEIDCDGGNHKILRSYIDHFDGHTDIAPTIVAEQLAEKYPEALFIHTTRPRDEWAHALVRFVSEQPRKCLLQRTLRHVNFMMPLMATDGPPIL